MKPAIPPRDQKRAPARPPKDNLRLSTQNNNVESTDNANAEPTQQQLHSIRKYQVRAFSFFLFFFFPFFLSYTVSVFLSSSSFDTNIYRDYIFVSASWIPQRFARQKSVNNSTVKLAIRIVGSFNSTFSLVDRRADFTEGRYELKSYPTKILRFILNEYKNDEKMCKESHFDRHMKIIEIISQIIDGKVTLIKSKNFAIY